MAVVLGESVVVMVVVEPARIVVAIGQGAASGNGDKNRDKDGLKEEFLN